VERHCEKLSGRITELDAKVSSLPAIEYDVTPLSDLSQSVDAIQDELEGYRKELEALQQTARDLEGFLDRRVAEQLQALDNQLDNLSAGVAGKDAEVSAAARRTQDVTEKLDAVENTISALNSIVEGDVEDQVDSLESSAIQDYYENVQVGYTLICCVQCTQGLPHCTNGFCTKCSVLSGLL
jgi:chromosome segregation ATPase